MNKYKFTFAANISTMFKEHKDLVDRYEAAINYGFKAIECQFPYDCQLNDLCSGEKPIIFVLINSYPGVGDDKFGFACVPEHEQQFKDSLNRSIKYAHALGCKKIHIIAGMVDFGYEDSTLQKTYISNLKYAACKFEKENIIGLIEPLCPAVKPNYFLSSYEKAVEYINIVGSNNLKLLLDVFHLRMLCTEVEFESKLKGYLPYAGHVQISQAPGRQEPSCPGLINFESVFHILQEKKYSDFIGLEYSPSTTTEASFGWLHMFGLEI